MLRTDDCGRDDARELHRVGVASIRPVCVPPVARKTLEHVYPDRQLICAGDILEISIPTEANERESRP